MLNRLAVCILSFLTLIALGCSSLYARYPMPSIESPEAAGKRRFRGELSASPMQQLQISSDASARPPDLSQPTLERGGSLGFFGTYGLGEKLELGLRVDGAVRFVPNFFIAKLQVLGDPSGKAKRGNFSISTFAGAGVGGGSISGDQKGVFGPGGHRWQAHISQSATQLGSSLGYRVSDDLLIFLGARYMDFTTHASIRHEQSDDGSSPAAEYLSDYRANARQYSLGAHYEIGQTPGYIGLEAGMYDFNMGKIAHRHENYVTVILGFR